MPKEICPKCLNKTKSLKHHICQTTFNMDVTVNTSWAGDALHHLDVVESLIDSGHSSSVSNTLMQDYTKNVSQASYLKTTDKYDSILFVNLSDHKLGTLFEHFYYIDEQFRAKYLADTFGVVRNVSRGSITKDTVETFSLESTTLCGFFKELFSYRCL